MPMNGKAFYQVYNYVNMQTIPTYLEVFTIQYYDNSYVTSFMLKILGIVEDFKTPAITFALLQCNKFLLVIISFY